MVWSATWPLYNCGVSHAQGTHIVYVIEKYLQQPENQSHGNQLKTKSIGPGRIKIKKELCIARPS